MSPLTKSPRSQRWLAGGAAAGVTYFAGVAIALEAFRSDNNLLKVALSFYAHGPYGFWLNSAFLVLAAGTFALALGLRPWFYRPRQVLVVSLLLGLSGLGDMLAGLFNNDFPPPGFPPRSLTGTFHTLDSFTSLLAFDLAMFVFAQQFRTHPVCRKGLPTYKNTPLPAWRRLSCALETQRSPCACKITGAGLIRTLSRPCGQDVRAATACLEYANAWNWSAEVCRSKAARAQGRACS